MSTVYEAARSSFLTVELAARAESRGGEHFARLQSAPALAAVLKARFPLCNRVLIEPYNDIIIASDFNQDDFT